MRFIFVLLLLFPLCLAAAEPEGVTAPSYLLVEMDNLQIIAGKDYHKRLPPASTTKVMTTLLAIEKLQGNETIVPGKEVRAISASKMNLIPGKGYRSTDLMKGTMVESANDAAYALAVYIGGTESNFAALMNEKARALGAIDTNFVNASGLPVDDQFTTCYDLAIIFKQALLSPRFRELISTEYFLFEDAYKRVQYKNHNRLLFCFEPSIGGKTGYTRKARHCYVGAFEKDGKVYILTLLGSHNLWGDTVQILKILYNRVPTDEELRLAKYCSPTLTSRHVKKIVKLTAKKKVSKTKKRIKRVR
jgi:D-alanyl-D-alanine carboxypeptidase (penicillin-binding protein 5/6)